MGRVRPVLERMLAAAEAKRAYYAGLQEGAVGERRRGQEAVERRARKVQEAEEEIDALRVVLEGLVEVEDRRIA